MARPKEVMDDELARAADAALREIRDHQICFRLQAMVSYSRNPVHVVASVMGVNVTTLWRWAKRFRKEGVQGLRDRPKGHNPSKLNSTQQYSIATWLDTGKNAEGYSTVWTIPLLQQEVHRVFGISMGRTPLRLLMRKMGFRLKVPRPKHYKANPAAQEAFKKNS
jgi:transposase